jgi:hypothetical protein
MNSESPQPSPDREHLEEATIAGIAGVERAFLRLTFWQTLLSLAGVFVGAVALYAALTESQAVREQTAASVWPYVQLMVNDTDAGGDAHFALTLTNVGVGPARMGSARLQLEGRVYRSWRELAGELVTGEEAKLGKTWGKNSLSGRVLAPGEGVVAFTTGDRKLALAMQRAVYNGSASLSFCFCSIFDQCWVRDSSMPVTGTVAPVAHCPDYGEDAFRD